MNFKEQLMLMDKLSPAVDEIIKGKNEGVRSFKVTHRELFDKHYPTIAEMVEGAFLGIKTDYSNGIITILEESE